VGSAEVACVNFARAGSVKPHASHRMLRSCAESLLSHAPQCVPLLQWTQPSHFASPRIHLAASYKRAPWPMQARSLQCAVLYVRVTRIYGDRGELGCFRYTQQRAVLVILASN
jgi:hypothetical protein